ncbi:bifunctional DNA primase/polymerase [Oceanospirillaceae bacterium]|nr:bifunctional DNA primase/polymerase [Oceanospirillaceae bacterium]
MMIDAALRLSSNGTPIFPVKADKSPHIKSWQQKATTDQAIVKKWWEKWPEANIAIPTGARSGLVAVDVDVKNGVDGYESLSSIEARFGEQGTRRIETPSGGVHLIYRCNQKVKTRTGILDGIDIRGDGGYIVAQGSVIGGSAYQVIHDVLPEEMTIDMVSWINDTQNTKRPCEIGMAKGERNTHIFKLASSYRGQDLDMGSALAACKNVALRCIPPLEEAEVIVTVENVYRAYQPNAIKVTVDDIKQCRDRSEREANVEWSKCLMAQRIALVHTLPAILFAAQEKIKMALWYQGRLTDIEFRHLAGVEGPELDLVMSIFEKYGELYGSSEIDDLYEDSYSLIRVKSISGAKGGRGISSSSST